MVVCKVVVVACAGSLPPISPDKASVVGGIIVGKESVSVTLVPAGKPAQPEIKTIRARKIREVFIIIKFYYFSLFKKLISSQKISIFPFFFKTAG